MRKHREKGGEAKMELTPEREAQVLQAAYRGEPEPATLQTLAELDPDDDLSDLPVIRPSEEEHGGRS